MLCQVAMIIEYFTDQH